VGLRPRIPYKDLEREREDRKVYRNARGKPNKAVV
jgi:hypothetical protein